MQYWKGAFLRSAPPTPGPSRGRWRNDGLLLLQETLSFQSFSSPWMEEHRLPRLRTDTAPAPSAPSSSPRVSRGQSFFTMETPGGSCQGSTYQLPHAKFYIWMDNGAVRTSSGADLVTLLSGGALIGGPLPPGANHSSDTLRVATPPDTSWWPGPLLALAGKPPGGPPHLLHSPPCGEARLCSDIVRRNLLGFPRGGAE